MAEKTGTPGIPEMKNKETVLLPCPFCGKKKCGVQDFGDNCMFVQCENCCATGPVLDENITREQADEMARALWNRRKLSSDLLKMLELGRDWLTNQEGAFDRLYDFIEKYWVEQNK